MAKAQGTSEVVARGADVPLALAQSAQTRDALVDPRDGDIIPDNEEKGYHVGEVRQPAEPVLTRGGAVRFESTGEGGGSKFLSYAEEQAEMDRRLSSDPAYAGTPFVPIHADPAEADKAYRARLRESEGGRSRSTGDGAAADLDADSAKVAKAQAADDKS